MPGNNGGFLRVTDAVKGPFFPNPPPIPTFPFNEFHENYPKTSLHAPLSDIDMLLPVEPEDAY